ncbi:MAG: 16S rRNA (adenine(1518)-N(6)/adenine(1519)-N(6))-dimethyltransferase RsmA [Firmicutes bacterium]|nr:16S rRNA (adenine(1518)-N(6)/adenine(1519)-N(6))-dimethyltransferase RsmA [Bacillota bacterium]
MEGELKLCSPAVIRGLLDEFDAAPRKDFGQNFLINESVPKKIAEVAGEDAPENVLEIGPGIGCLTRELSRRFSRVAAVEIDKKLILLLQKTLSGCGNVRVIESDIMKLDIARLSDEEFAGGNFCVCANLPYYITTPVITKLLTEGGERLKSVTVMVQSEVADRLTARAGTKDYGAITAGVAYFGRASRVMRVSAGSFYPAPKVDSAVVKITLYGKDESTLRPKSREAYFELLTSAFANRRKTLVNSVSSNTGFEKADVESALYRIGLDVRVRAEALTPEDFARLADELTG